MSDSITLQDLVDDVAIVSAEAQGRLTDLHGGDSWAVDMAVGILTFRGPTGVGTDCEAQFLGSSAQGSGTWLWGWENVNGFPASVLVAARHVRAVGGALPELGSARLPLTEDLDLKLVLAAKALTHTFTHYQGSVRGGTTAWFLLDHPSFALSPPTLEGVARAIKEGTEGTVVADHRRAVAAYAARRGLTMSAASDGTLSIHMNDGVVSVQFDEEDRVVDVDTAVGRVFGSGQESEGGDEWEYDDSEHPQRRSWFRRRQH